MVRYDRSEKALGSGIWGCLLKEDEESGGWVGIIMITAAPGISKVVG